MKTVKKFSIRTSLAAMVAFASLWLPTQLVGAVEISGAGASLPYPVYSKWANSYKDKSGTIINFQSIGSGGGLKAIVAKTVDFGASDAPQTADWQQQNQVMQFPMIISGIVAVANIKGLKSGQLKLTGRVLADIYLGKITRWSDNEIKKINPLLALPDLPISVIYRNDSSGTTYNFSSYLSKVNPAWREKVGVATSIEWPVGLGAKGSDGVASLSERVVGSISYMELSYAKKSSLPYILLENHDGNYPIPSVQSFTEAAANANWPAAAGFFLTLTNQPGRNSWPITAASFILVHTNATENSLEMLKYFDWCYRNGDKLALSLDYSPMPIAVVNVIQAAWTKSILDKDKPIWTAR